MTLDTRAAAPDSAIIAKLEPGQLYWMAIEPIWEVVSIYDGAEQYLLQASNVSVAQGLLLAAHWCQSEVCNGGFHQFFSNATGVLAPEAARGFGLIEVPAAAEVVRKALSLFGQVYPRDHAERRTCLRMLERPGKERSDWDPFFSLDGELYTATGTAQFDRQADAFVRGHMSLFFKSA